MRAGRPRFKRFQLAPTGPSLQSAARLRDGSAALYTIGDELANSEQWPNWYEGNPFKAKRDEALANP